MAYRLKLDEPLEVGIRRIALEQIDRITGGEERGSEQLGKAPVAGKGGIGTTVAGEALALDQPAFQVHETRKGLKRIRALLRLTRSGIKPDTWRQLNCELRDIGRLLSSARDNDVRRATLAALRNGAPRALASAIDRMEAALVSAEWPTATNLPEVAEVIRRLAAVRRKLRRLGLTGDASVIEAGLAATHRAGRKALERALAEPIDEAYHELRKAVQLHWRQTQLLVAAWPGPMRARIDEARALSATIGEDHDLGMLADWAGAQPATVVAPNASSRVGKACRARQVELRRRIALEADRLFAGKPARQARLVVGAWAAAQALATTGKGADAAN